MTFTGRTREDDIAFRAEAGCQHDVKSLDHSRHPGEIIGNAPTVEPAVFNPPLEWIMTPVIGLRNGLSVRVCEHNKAPAAKIPWVAPHDACTVTVVNCRLARKLLNHRNIPWPVADGLNAASEPLHLGGNAPLHGLLPSPPCSNQLAQKLQNVFTRPLHLMTRRLPLHPSWHSPPSVLQDLAQK